MHDTKYVLNDRNLASLFEFWRVLDNNINLNSIDMVFKLVCCRFFIQVIQDGKQIKIYQKHLTNTVFKLFYLINIQDGGLWINTRLSQII